MFSAKQIALLLAFLAFFALSGPSYAAPPEQNPETTNRSALSLGQAAILGIVEGLTEYLPVSSTGHLLLAERALSIGRDPNATAAENMKTKEASDAYTIVIQLGAILAVLGLYYRRVRQMLNGLVGRDAEGRQLLINVLVGFFPAAVIGLLFNKLIKSYLFGVWPVVIAWFVGGLAILLVSRSRTERNPSQAKGLLLTEITWKMALFIGVAQCIAMWPGVSRSLVTIVGGVLVGLSLSAAVEFSFLLGLITLSAATAYDLLKHGQLMLETFDGLSLFVGVAFAFVAAIVSVKWMVGYLQKHGLAVFGYYRIALSVVVAGLILNGII